jgi:preprotein translocase subunit SecY
MKRRRFYQTVDIFDRLWYALTPMAGYFIVMIAAGGLMAQRRGSLDLLAAGLGVLLLLGLRNAWDMTVWVVIRSPNR